MSDVDYVINFFFHRLQMSLGPSLTGSGYLFLLSVYGYTVQEYGGNGRCWFQLAYVIK